MSNSWLLRILEKNAGPTLAVVLISGALAVPSRTLAQGCVAARGAGMTCAPGIHGGETLPPSSGWQASVGYRWLHSDRHFTGDHEDKQREREGSQVINDSHFTDVSLTYAIDPRFSGTLTLPWVVHDRSQTVGLTNGAGQTVSRQRYHTQSAGIADVRAEFNGWILDPATARKGNVLLGLGFAAPTGEKDAKDTFQVRTNNNIILGVERNVDQSIQPGTGGWGIILDLYAYREIVPRLNAFVNGAYTITPEEKNGVLTSRSNPFEAEMSIADTYMGRWGLEYVLWPKHAVALSLAGRIEGVPVYDAVGGSDGFRRPGFAISIEPGIMASINSWSFGFYAPVALYRNRERSVPDKQYQRVSPRSPSRHGDSAFADFLVMFNISKRF